MLSRVPFTLCAGSVALSRVNNPPSAPFSDGSLVERRMVLFSGAVLEAVGLERWALRKRDYYDSVTLRDVCAAKSIT